MNWWIVLFGVSLTAVFLVCNGGPSIKMTNAVCNSYNKSWVVFHYCRLKAYSRYKTSLHINATFLYPTNNVSMNLKLMKRANGYKPFLFDVTFDACSFLRRRNQPFVKMVHEMIKNFSTLNHTCPYVGLQVVSDLHRFDLPLPFPGGEFLLLMNYFFYGKLQFCTNIYFTVVEDLLSS